MLHEGVFKLWCVSSLSYVPFVASSGEQWAECGPAAERQHIQREPEHGGQNRREQESSNSRQTIQGKEKEHFQETHTNAR